MLSRSRSLLLVVCLASFVPAVLLGASSVGEFSNPWVIAGLFMASGLLCFLAAGWALIVSVRLDFVEISLVASAMTTSAIFVFVHGLFSPGAIFDNRVSEFAVSGQLSAVVAIPALTYMLLTRGRVEQSSAWRGVCIGIPIAGVLLAASIPRLEWLEPLTPKTLGVAILVLVALVVHVLASLHFLGLADRFRDGYSLQLSLALMVSAAVPIFFYFGGPGTGAYWWTHGLCMTGVTVASVAILRKAQEASISSQLVGSLITKKPVRMLDIDAAPSVLRHLQSIERPDDPRLRVAMRTAVTLTELQDRRELDSAAVLPLFRSALESLSAATPVRT